MNLKRLHALKAVTWAIKSTEYNLLKLSYLKTFLLLKKNWSETNFQSFDI